MRPATRVMRTPITAGGSCGALGSVLITAVVGAVVSGEFASLSSSDVSEPPYIANRGDLIQPSTASRFILMALTVEIHAVRRFSRDKNKSLELFRTVWNHRLSRGRFYSTVECEC